MRRTAMDWAVLQVQDNAGYVQALREEEAHTPPEQEPTPEEHDPTAYQGFEQGVFF